MRLQELFEAATDIVYHYTSTHNAARILKDGTFKLSASTFSKAEHSYAPKGYDYFLSTSRSKVGDYHRYVGTGGVMFVLDGRWLSARYPVKPVDYWERAWQHSPDRTRETEDRVFSKQPEISIDCVTAVHILLKEQDEARSPLTRTIMIAAKIRKIPTYFYTDEAAWRTQNTAKSVTVGDAKDMLKGQQRIPSYQRPVRGLPARRGDHPWGKSSILDWVELLNKKPGQTLSPTADKIRYNVMYYGDMSSQLQNDLYNARQPRSTEYDIANKFIAYLKSNNMTLTQVVDAIKAKWSKK